jgi:alkaline phosphatase D
LFAYVDVDAPEYAQQKGTLRQVYLALSAQAGLSPQEAAAKADTWVKGKLALAYVNQALTSAGAGALAISPAGKPRGLAFVHMGKLNLFDVRGTRNIVIKDPYDLYSAYRYLGTQKASENVYGTEQENWLKEKLTATNTWKFIISSVSLSALILDLRQKMDIPDPSLRQRYYFTTDQWDGFPSKKKELLTYVKTAASNAVFLSGDIHASFASVEEGVPTLTAPSISSGSIKEEASTAVQGAGFAQGSAIYRYIAVETDQTLRAANPGMVFSEADRHGFLVVEAKPSEVLATYHLLPSSEVHKDYTKRTPEELQRQFITHALRVQNGTITDA